MASFDIKLFGAIEITRDGQLLTDFRSQKALAILAHLISEGRPITREYLAGLAWPEVEQSRALGLLRRSLHNLSSQLPDCLEVNRRTVFFKPDAPATIDTRHFVDLAAQAEITGWEAAADLYRAPFLQGVYLSDCPTFEHWLISEQQHWQDQADALLDRLIQALSDQGNYASALNYANRRLVLAPWREATHRQVMRLLLYNADRSAALAQYDRCVAILADELGVEPEPETQALYEQIQLADPYPPHNVPPQVTPFLGRQSELAELTRMIANPVQRLITLVGPGGIGKTRLAIALAERQLGRPTNQPDPDAPTYAYFTHGIYLVSLTAVETASGLVPKIADALKFHLTADSAQRSPKQQLLDYLRQKRLLLILDNFEQLLNDFEGAAATGLLLEIVQAAPEVKLLVTTRERLQISGEQVYPIQGLAYPDLEGSGAIDERDYPAMALFRQIAQHIRLDFRCTGETAIAVAQICAALQGMPLAIELAAATINILTPAEILTELTHSLDLLATTTRHIPARHRSIRAAFETSWQQLSPTEQTCFQQLSVFRGGFTREAAQAVASASRMVLAGLANKSFIHFHQERQRYDVHELMRQFGAAKLSETATEQAIACEQHSRYYAALLEQQGRYLKGSPHQIKALTIVAQEIDNAHMCWQWALDNGQLATLRQAVEGLGHFFEIQSRHQEGEMLFGQAADHLSQIIKRSEVDQALANLLQGRILAWQGVYAHRLGLLDKSRTVSKQSLAVLDALGEAAKVETMLAHFNLGIVDGLYAGNFDEAQRHFVENKRIAEEADALWELESALNLLGSVALDQGSYLEAKAYYEESLAIAQEINDQWGMGIDLGSLSEVSYNLGDFAAAKQFAQEAYHINLVIDHQVGLLNALRCLGNANYGLEDYPTARDCFRGALEMGLQLGVLPDVLYILPGFAALLVACDEAEHAIALLTLCLNHPASPDWAKNKADTMLDRIRVSYSPQRFAQAQVKGQTRELSAVVAEIFAAEVPKPDSGFLD